MRNPDFSGELCKDLPSYMYRTALGPLFLSLVVGCGPEVAFAPGAAVRDSAGVTIVENHGSEFPDGGGWSLAESPSLVIGSLGDPEGDGLYRVRGALRLPDGRIAVAVDGSRELRIYGVDGAPERSLGGEGEGPGEFTSLLLAGLLGDSLVVLDRRLRRVSLVHPDEGFARSFTVAEPVANFPIGGWFFETGSVLIEDFPLADDAEIEDGFGRGPSLLKSCDLSGELLSDFGELPGEETFTTTTHQAERGLTTELLSVPFGKSPQIAVKGDVLYFGSQDRYEVMTFGSDGSLRTIVRLVRPPVPVTAADLESLIEEELDGLNGNDARFLRQAFAKMPVMEFRPAHGAISADREGFLFVEEFRAPGIESVPVNVFDPDGRLVGRFEIPADIEILEIGPDYLLALHEDAMDVEFVHLYELTRPG